MSTVEGRFPIDDDIPFRYVQRIGDEHSELAEKGKKVYDDGKVGFSIQDKNPIDIHLRITAVNPNDPNILDNIENDSKPPLLKVWQPNIERGKRTHLRRYQTPDHGLTNTKTMQSGLLEGAYHDVLDYAVVGRSMLVGATLEFNGDLRRILSHDKPFRLGGTRIIPSSSQDTRIFNTQGPDYQRSELFYFREGFAVTAMWDKYPTARELTYDQSGKALWDQRYHRVHRLRNDQKEIGITRLSGIRTRLLDAAEQVHGEIDPLEMVNGHILRVTVWDTREELVPFDINQVLGYQSRNYAEKIAGGDGRCPVSGHEVEMDPGWEEFGSVVQRRNKIGVPPFSSLPVVRFSVVIVAPNIQMDLKEGGREVDTCPACFPTICHGLHEATADEGPTICPGCDRIWREDHICANLTGSIYSSIYLPRDSITILENGKVERDLTGMDPDSVALIELLNTPESIIISEE